jgi:tetratricopeptide (TPR) repeat protein
LDVLERLIDKSLVLVDNAVDRPPRYRLLEPLRQFGQDRLQERGEMCLIQDRHAAFFLERFEQAEQPFYTSGLNPAWLSRLDPEQDNLRTALRWLLGQGNIESALRLAAAARPFWFIRGSLAEGRRWLEEALALDPHEEVHAGAALASFGVSGGSRPSEHKARRLAVRAKALMALGHLAIYQGDVTVCQRAEQRSLQIYRQLHDTWGAVYPLQLLGRAAELRADFAEARRYLDEAIATGQSTGQPVVVAAALVRLAEVAAEEDRTAEAQRLTEEALKIANARGATGLICQAMSVLAELQYRLGRRDAARLAWEEALARAREIGYGTVWLIVILFGLGRLERWQGATDRSRVLFAEGLTLAHEMSRWELARGLEAMVEVATAEGRAESALHLAGTAAALRDAMGTPLWPSERARLETALARARQSLSQFEADAAWMRGWTRPADQTLGLALELLGQPQAATTRQPPRFFSATSSRP